MERIVHACRCCSKSSSSTALFSLSSSWPWRRLTGFFCLSKGQWQSFVCGSEDNLVDEHGVLCNIHWLLHNSTEGPCSDICCFIYTTYWWVMHGRRKFRSQTSDNMDRWKAEMGRVREKRRVEERRSEKRKSQKKEDADARKGRKVAKHFVFPMICGSERSKSRLAKAAGAEPAGQMRDKKLHAVVARITFRSQNVQNAPSPDHFWKLRCRKSACRCGAKRISKSKCTKQTILGPLLEVEMSKKCTPLGREAHFEVKMLKTPHVRAAFGRSDVVSSGRRKGLCTLSKVSKMWGFCGISKNKGRRGTFREDLQRCIFRGRRSTRDMFIRAVRRSGRWFPERGCILEHQIFRFAEMILRDRCSTSYDLASLFRGRRSSLDRWTGKIAKRIGTRPSALHSTFHFWRKTRRIASFLMLSSLKNEEVSQTCFVFDVVKLKHWGSLAELLRFFNLSSSKPEDVSQNSFVVFKLADRQ